VGTTSSRADQLWVGRCTCQLGGNRRRIDQVRRNRRTNQLRRIRSRAKQRDQNRRWASGFDGASQRGRLDAADLRRAQR
jgi:hypothetical protein